jgi:predicted Zn-dependent protease with MMP-like domain
VIPLRLFPDPERIAESRANAEMAGVTDRDIVVRVEEFADSEQLPSVGLTNPWDLIGLYQGRPVGE